ncbi:uncharacterized protein LOC129582743 [Paramacrobiotus metropolitanus]|uniref:uncharacterized protein LOC129582743 n=1 Tax=Paramacrobiotus metropolitanus TaxID=2943436 RepID=UPI002445CE49|nr:uncharacterized protein LOC129582743 [Paramacrobiotus metropolitanus]
MAQMANSFFTGLDSIRDMSFDSPSSIASRSLLVSSPPHHSRLEFGTWANPSPSPTLERGVPVMLPPPLTPLGRFNRGIPSSSRAARLAILRDPGNSHVVWSVAQPPRNCGTSSPFCKVFLGGVPWDITETDLQKTFGVFGPLRVEWPGVHDHSSTQRPKGHLYLLFEDERSVMKLLARRSNDGHHNQHGSGRTWSGVAGGNGNAGCGGGGAVHVIAGPGRGAGNMWHGRGGGNGENHCGGGGGAGQPQGRRELPEPRQIRFQLDRRDAYREPGPFHAIRGINWQSVPPPDANSVLTLLHGHEYFGAFINFAVNPRFYPGVGEHGRDHIVFRLLPGTSVQAAAQEREYYRVYPVTTWGVRVGCEHVGTVFL